MSLPPIFRGKSSAFAGYNLPYFQQDQAQEHMAQVRPEASQVVLLGGIGRLVGRRPAVAYEELGQPPHRRGFLGEVMTQRVTILERRLPFPGGQPSPACDPAYAPEHAGHNVRTGIKISPPVRAQSKQQEA